MEGAFSMDGLTVCSYCFDESVLSADIIDYAHIVDLVHDMEENGYSREEIMEVVEDAFQEY